MGQKHLPSGQNCLAEGMTAKKNTVKNTILKHAYLLEVSTNSHCPQTDFLVPDLVFLPLLLSPLSTKSCHPQKGILWFYGPLIFEDGDDIFSGYVTLNIIFCWFFFGLRVLYFVNLIIRVFRMGVELYLFLDMYYSI